MMRFVVLTLPLLGACSARASRDLRYDSETRPAEPVEVAHAPAPEPVDVPDRQVIFNGSLVLQTPEPDMIEEKIAALAKHVSQVGPPKGRDIGKWIKERSAELGKEHKMAYAEAFRVIEYRR
jgi:hypothetical protein